MNSTDLHIKFKLETGLYPHWKRKDSEPQKYQKDFNYGTLYAEWLEKKYLELLNNNIKTTNK